MSKYFGVSFINYYNWCITIVIFTQFLLSLSCSNPCIFSLAPVWLFFLFYLTLFWLVNDMVREQTLHWMSIRFYLDRSYEILITLEYPGWSSAQSNKVYLFFHWGIYWLLKILSNQVRSTNSINDFSRNISLKTLMVCTPLKYKTTAK